MLHVGTGRHRAKRGRVIRLAAAAVAPIATLIGAGAGYSQTRTWDASGTNPASPTDGSGNWNTTTDANWSDGALNSAWPNGSAAVIGNGGAAGTITINDASGTVSAAGITFNPTSTGNYTIAGAGTSTLTLVGNGAISIASGVSPTISAPIVGTSGLAIGGPGTLNLSGLNTFTGGVAVNSATLVVAPGSSLGDASNAFSIGTPNTGTSLNDAVGAGVLNTSATVSSFKSATNNTAINTLSIANGSTLTINGNAPFSGLNSTVNGVFIVGSPNVSAPITTKLTLSGGGSLVVSGGASGGSFLVGVGNSNTSANTMTPTLDMTGLSSFTFTTGTGAVPANGGNEFAVGHGAGTTATLNLATNSSITAGTLTVGDNSITPGLGSGALANAPSNPSVMNLGSGTNTLNVARIVIGNVRSQGTIQWLNATTTGSLTIAGPTGGASTADITIGQFSAGTPPSSASSLNLAGHNAIVQAGTVQVGSFLTGGGNGTAGSGKGGSIIFDTGTFNVVNLQLANASGTGGLAGSNINGTFQLGSSSTSTGVLNVSGTFLIGNVTGSNVNAKATFTIRGGTANIFNNIIDASTANTSGNTLTLSGGTLNMNGFAIGTTAGGTGGTRTIGTVTLPAAGNSATLMSLGGNGINNAGLTMNGAGGLILTGTSNTYTGNTNITAGVLQFGQASDTAAPNAIGAGTVTNNSNLFFGSSQPTSVANVISGSGTVAMIGSGTTTLTGSNTYTGPTNFGAGSMTVASIGNGGVTGPLGAASNAAPNLVLTGGALRYTGGGESTDRLFSITANGGTLDASGSGPLVFANTAAAVSSDAGSRSGTLGTATARVTLPGVLDLSVGMPVTGTNIPAGTTIAAINRTTNTITLSATPTGSGTATLTFPGVLARTLTLTGSNTGDNRVDSLLGNSASGGTLSILKTGSGTWSLTNSNTYTGNTAVNAGTLRLTKDLTTSASVNVTGGTLELASDGSHNRVIHTPSVSIAGGRLDLQDNKLITQTPVGTVTSYIATGRNGGGWGGSGVVTSQSTATSGSVTSVGVAAASEVKGIAATATAVWAGQSVAGSDTLVMYTYGGDANLDGKINVDDYGHIDSSIPLGIAGWFNGDFNYDGKINVDDYGIIDSNVPIQGAAFPTAPNLSGVSAVPEPASFALLAAYGVANLHRRRRRLSSEMK